MPLVLGCLACTKRQISYCQLLLSRWHIIFVSCDNVALWRCGIVAFWYCDTVTLWRYDIVALWHYGVVTLWHCDIVALCQLLLSVITVSYLLTLFTASYNYLVSVIYCHLRCSQSLTPDARGSSLPYPRIPGGSALGGAPCKAPVTIQWVDSEWVDSEWVDSEWIVSDSITTY